MSDGVRSRTFIRFTGRDGLEGSGSPFVGGGACRSSGEDRISSTSCRVWRVVRSGVGFSVALALALALGRDEEAAGAVRRAFVGSGSRVGCDGVSRGHLGIDLGAGFGLGALALSCRVDVVARVSLHGIVNSTSSSPYET